MTVIGVRAVVQDASADPYGVTEPIVGEAPLL